jgi:hypothetical protein
LEQSMSFEIVVSHWLAREHGDPIARATLGQLELKVNARSLTLLEDRLARANRPFANLSAYDLAIWFAANWWRLRWEPERAGTDWRLSHSFTGVGNGYVWPNVTMLSDGEQVVLQVRPTGGAEWEPIRYLEHCNLVLSAADFEAAIDSFIAEVLARLAGCGLSETELHSLWNEVRVERSDPEITLLRKLEALLGFDAGAAPDEIIDSLHSDAQEDGYTAVEEVAAGFAAEAHQVIRSALESLDQKEELSSEKIIELAERRADWRSAGLPWQQACVAARIAREMWNLDGRPLRDDDLMGLLGSDANFIGQPALPATQMAAGRWSAPDRSSWRILLRSPVRVGRRFELCRLVADCLVAPSGELLLPATAAKTSRQKFQRAFAQELLCPFEALQARLGLGAPEDEQIEEAAEYFDVSPLLVRTTLVNKGILPRAEIETAGSSAA